MFKKSLEISRWLKTLQSEICEGLEGIDGKSKFINDHWIRAEGGGGNSKVISDGNVFEKGGVNFSHVYGKTPTFLLHENIHSISEEINNTDTEFSATGVSIVIHPESPLVPIIHMNIRFFEMSNGVYWFGGGIDLTPPYYSKDQYDFFHGELKRMCDEHRENFYSEFSKWADDYFYIKHRRETRGIGGIFFDRLTENEKITFDQIHNFWMATGKLFLPLYRELVLKTKDLKYNSYQKEWQLIRRGRYVEFNLIYDKGTKFGLETGGRIESILMSLPKHAAWLYNHEPEQGSPEYETLQFLRKSGINRY
jgi:coproporphyrinogen III oxidase